jgi:cell division protein FtsN
MAREYSNRRSSRNRGSAPSQFLVVVVTFLLGYLTASVFDIDTISHWMNAQILAHQEVKTQPTKAVAQQAQTPPKPKFEFYTLLANEKTGGATHTKTNVAATHPATSKAPAASAQQAAVSAANHLGVKSSAPNHQQKSPVKVAIAKPSPQTSASKGRYAVQVASFKTRQDAEHMRGSLTLKGFDVNVVPVTQARGNWFRVVVGPYANRDLALRAQITLAKNERLKGMLMNLGG